ncbi:MAG: hypothetical protein ABR529_15620 [Actinomycetota bacterium]
MRRSDDQLIQLTDLLYLVLENIDGKRDLDDIAGRVGESYGRRVSADNVRQLVEGTLTADGLVRRADGSEAKLEKLDPLLRLKLRTKRSSRSGP